MQTVKLSEEGLKNKAKKIRQFIHEKHGLKIPHGHCLDLVSLMYNFKDWNTASALLSRQSKILNSKVEIDTIGKFRDQTKHLTDETHLDASFDLDIIDLIRELEDGQTGTHYTFSFSSVDIHGDDDFATLNLEVKYEDCEFDQGSGSSLNEVMARHLGYDLRR